MDTAYHSYYIRAQCYADGLCDEIFAYKRLRYEMKSAKLREMIFESCLSLDCSF